jgi:2-dehydro-3-deoxyphosphogluconate aldolase / (4S)-4-hydroxy-2-oxoglutarate aldolase
MPARKEVCDLIEQIGVIPAIRVGSAAEALFATRAVFSGGITIAEITMTIPEAGSVIAELVRDFPGAAIGAGTVLDADAARHCLDCGASFLTSTGLVPEVVEFAHQHDVAVIPGALTPTEIMVARKAGVDFIKVFPCAQVGGPSYIRALKAPFPDVRLIATGGVDQQTAGPFIRAGAVALGVGEHLVPQQAVMDKDREWIRELSRRFVNLVKRARAH